MRLIDSAVSPLCAWLVASCSIMSAHVDFPLMFEQNRGQVPADVKFLARANGFGVFLTGPGAVLAIRGGNGEADCTVRLSVAGSRRLLVPRGIDPLPGKTNYLMSTDARNWRTDIPNFARVVYQEVIPGINLVFHGSTRELEYDFVVAPGRDVAAIRMRFEGNGGLHIDPQGDLLIRVRGRDIRQHRPRVYQATNGATRDVGGDFVIERDGSIGFRVGRYDHRQPLVIDPVIYSFTGAASGSSAGIAVDAAGEAFIAGATNLTSFPTTPGAVQTTFNGGTCNPNVFTPPGSQPQPPGPCNTAFVYKLNADGSHLIYATYLGTGYASAIAIDTAGNAYVTGGFNHQANIISAANFPVTPGLPFGGQNGAFVTKLNPRGNAIVYSAILGDYAQGSGIAVDAAGNAYVAGSVISGSFPTTSGAFQTRFRQSHGGFILKINSAGTALLYSTLLGGEGPVEDSTNSLALDAAGEAYVTGSAGSSIFPVTPGAYQSVAKGQNAFVAKLSADGSALLYATFLGGSGTDFGSAVAVDTQGAAYVGGGTTSADFPSTTAFGNPVGTQQPGSFIAKLSPAGDALSFSDLIGGASTLAIALDSVGAIYALGSGQGVPVTSNAELRCAGSALLLKVSADGKTLLYSSFLGNPDTEGATSTLALDAADNIYLPNNVGVWKLSPPSPAPVIMPPCFSQILALNEVPPGGTLAPGELAVIDGFNLGPQAAVYAALNSSGRFPTMLAGAQVMVGGYLAPLIYVQQGKIRFMTPFEIAGEQQAPVEVITGGLNSDPVTAAVAAAAPSVIQLQPVSVSCQGAVLNQDGSVNSATNPAAIGSVVSIFAEGAGQMNMPVVDGSLATAPFPAPLLPVKIWFQDEQNFGAVYYAGSAPGLIMGTLQVNARIPMNLTPGQVMFGLDVGGAYDNSRACLYVNTAGAAASPQARKAALH
jgi:uncharacterized protein (TIGR03437 family)